MASTDLPGDGRDLRQDEEPDSFPPTMSTDFEDDRPSRPRRPQADVPTPLWLRIGLGVAFAALALFAVVRAVRH